MVELKPLYDVSLNLFLNGGHFFYTNTRQCLKRFNYRKCAGKFSRTESKLVCLFSGWRSESDSIMLYWLSMIDKWCFVFDKNKIEVLSARCARENVLNISKLNLTWFLSKKKKCNIERIQTTHIEAFTHWLVSSPPTSAGRVE